MRKPRFENWNENVKIIAYSSIGLLIFGSLFISSWLSGYTIQASVSRIPVQSLFIEEPDPLALGYSPIVSERPGTEFIPHTQNALANSHALTSLHSLAEITYSLGLFAICALLTLQYTRLKKNRLLDQKKRNEIYCFIVAHPGINFSNILKELDIGNGTLIHHLEVLEQENLIVSKMINGKKIFYPRNKKPGYDIQIGTFSLSTRQAIIYRFLGEHGPKTMRDIETELDLKQSAVSYNIRKLLNLDLVTCSGGKRNALYRVKKLCDVAEE